MKKILLFSIFMVGSYAIGMEIPQTAELQGAKNLVALKGSNREQHAVAVQLVKLMNTVGDEALAIDSSGLFGFNVTTQKPIKRTNTKTARELFTIQPDSIKRKRKVAVAGFKTNPRTIRISPRLKQLNEIMFQDSEVAFEPVQEANNTSLHNQLKNLELEFLSSFPIADSNDDLNENRSADL
jgi:hypothetical protein